jgi:hypothetical protein
MLNFLQQSISSEYEEKELHFHEEMQRKLIECDAQIQKLENELVFLTQEDSEARGELIFVIFFGFWYHIFSFF